MAGSLSRARRYRTPRDSLAETVKMLPIRRQIARTLFKAADAAAGEFESTSLPPLFRRHQFQSASDDLRFGAPCRLLQLFEHSAVVLAEARVNVGLHPPDVAQNV